MAGYQDIRRLLHDARLTSIGWEPHLAEMRLTFSCLRRHVDGSAIDEPTVELVLQVVTAIAAYYSPACIEVRCSNFAVLSPFTADDLMDWSRAPIEAAFSVDSRHEELNRITAFRIDWLLGEDTARDQDERDVCLVFNSRSYAINSVETGLYIRCQSIQPMAHGAPLSIEDWHDQYRAWWQGWQVHWAAKQDDDAEETSSLEDAFIPAGTDPLPDLSYQPPSKPIFQVGNTDTPFELLMPISDFHEARDCRDWLRLARCYPDFDVADTERAAQLGEQCLNCEFGRWVYLRQIDSWWAEGKRACVVVRGIEHAMPAEGEPATNTETVITYGLRKSNDRWIIWSWSQGWPKYGSAPSLDEQPSWYREWSLGQGDCTSIRT